MLISQAGLNHCAKCPSPALDSFETSECEMKCMMWRSSEVSALAVDCKDKGIIRPLDSMSQTVLSPLKIFEYSLWKVGLHPALIYESKFDSISVTSLHSLCLKEQ